MLILDKVPFCSVIIELLTFSRSGIGQCTLGRGGAESVLTLSPTVIGVVLHRLGARKGKYTSASLSYFSLVFRIANAIQCHS